MFGYFIICNHFLKKLRNPQFIEFCFSCEFLANFFSKAVFVGFVFDNDAAHIDIDSRTARELFIRHDIARSLRDKEFRPTFANEVLRTSRDGSPRGFCSSNSATSTICSHTRLYLPGSISRTSDSVNNSTNKSSNSFKNSFYLINHSCHNSDRCLFNSFPCIRKG